MNRGIAAAVAALCGGELTTPSPMPFDSRPGIFGDFAVQQGLRRRPLGRRLRLGFVGGGRGGQVGAWHASGARLSSHWDIVAGALSTDPRVGVLSAHDWDLDESRSYSDCRAMAAGASRMWGDRATIRSIHLGGKQDSVSGSPADVQAFHYRRDCARNAKASRPPISGHSQHPIIVGEMRVLVQPCDPQGGRDRASPGSKNGPDDQEEDLLPGRCGEAWRDAREWAICIPLITADVYKVQDVESVYC
jgi:hypothetical protein